MDFVLNTTTKKSFRQYVEILQPIMKFTSKEADILAELMYQNYLNQDIPERARNQYLFSTDNRKVMRNNLNMSVGSFNNNMASLKKRGILKGEILPKKLQVLPQKHNGKDIVSLKFYFVVDAEERTENN